MGLVVIFLARWIEEAANLLKNDTFSQPEHEKLKAAQQIYTTSKCKNKNALIVRDIAFHCSYELQILFSVENRLFQGKKI